MNLTDLIDSRYSCRSYADKPLGEDVVEELCRTAARAPSACNSQPWKIHALFGEKKNALAAALEGMGLNAHAKSAPCLLAIEETPARYLSRFDGVVGENEWAKYDIGILAAHIVLLAKERGIDSCIIGYSDRKKVREILSTSNPVPLFIALGYAKEGDTMPVKRRKNEEEIFVLEK